MNKGDKIVLTDLETKIARHVGKHRYLNARSKNVTNAKIGDQSNQETDIEGVAGEIAFCKAMNLYPDLQTEEIPKHDAILVGGATVDVKQTKYDNGMLLVTTKKIDDPSDIYILMTGSMPEFTFRGGMPSDLVFQEKRIVDLGYGESYGVKQHDLWDIDELVWRWEYQRD